MGQKNTGVKIPVLEKKITFTEKLRCICSLDTAYV